MKDTSYLWKTYGIPFPETEYKFDPIRRWRFDYCWPEKLIAVEIEGGIWTKGRHNRSTGFLADMKKYNAAGKIGYRIFRFTPQEFKNGIAHDFMKGVLA